MNDVKSSFLRAVGVGKKFRFERKKFFYFTHGNQLGSSLKITRSTIPFFFFFFVQIKTSRDCDFDHHFFFHIDCPVLIKLTSLRCWTAKPKRPLMPAQEPNGNINVDLFFFLFPLKVAILLSSSFI